MILITQITKGYKIIINRRTMSDPEIGDNCRFATQYMKQNHFISEEIL